MAFPKRRRNWKRVQPHSLREAFRLCVDYALDSRNLSIPRIAELMGETEDSLYKWLSTGRMPAVLIPVFENACGIHFVSEYLATSANRVVIEIPTGRSVGPLAINELQTAINEAVNKLIRFYANDADQEETEDGLTAVIKQLAWHRGNVANYEQPELDLTETRHAPAKQ